MVFYSFRYYFFSIKSRTNKRGQIVQKFILKQNFGQKNWQNEFHFANLKNEKTTFYFLLAAKRVATAFQSTKFQKAAT